MIYMIYCCITCPQVLDGIDKDGINYCLILCSQDRHAILTIRDVNKDDSAQYRVVADNDLGTDSAIIKIQISGKLCLLITVLCRVLTCAFFREFVMLNCPFFKYSWSRNIAFSITN